MAILFLSLIMLCCTLILCFLPNKRPFLHFFHLFFIQSYQGIQKDFAVFVNYFMCKGVAHLKYLCTFVSLSQTNVHSLIEIITRSTLIINNK